MQKRILALLLALVMLIGMMPATALAADAILTASLAEAKSYIDGITINNSSNDPATVVKNFKTHFTWDNEKRENSKSYLFDWSYYNGVVFEGIEYVYEVTGESVYKDYVVEYMSSLITSSGGWATCTNSGYTSKQCAGYNATHGADCYKTASLLLDSYEMTGDSRYLTMAKTLYADLDSAAGSYSLKNAGYNYRHTWASDPSPDLWLDGLYMILPFRAEYARYIGDQEELDLIVSRMQWVSDNMYNSSKGLFYHAADSASSNSGTYWLRSIGWYAAAIVDIMDSMEGENLEAMKQQLKKLVDGMKACQNSSNGMWLNNMNASQSSTNPYETSGTALTCYAVMKAVNNGWLDESYADMAILAFNGICNEKLSGSTLTDICFKGAPGSSNSTFYDNEGKGLGPFIMFYAEVLEYVNSNDCNHVYETVTVDATCTENGSVTSTCTLCGDATTEVIEATGHKYNCVITDATADTDGSAVYTCTVCGHSYTEIIPATGGWIALESGNVYILDTDGVDTGAEHKYIVVGSNCNYALTLSGSTVGCGTVTISNNQITLDNASGYEFYFASNSKENGTYLLTQDGSKTVYHSSGNMYYGSDSKGYWYIGSSSNGAYQIYDYDNLNWYLNYGYVWASESCSRFAVSSNTRTVRLFKNVDLYARLAGETEQTWTNTDGATLDSVLAKLSIETSTDSSNITGTAAVTADMITWNTAFDGTTAGTYTGTVTYNGTALGSVTVNIISAHNYKSVVTAPTCTEKGYTTHTCTICGDTYVDTYTDTLGHSYTAVVTAPTCTAEGFTTYTCACGDSYTADKVAALGHDYESVTVEPTCTENGYTVYTCTVCGDGYAADYTEAWGHTEIVDAAVEPGCMTTGLTAGSHCGVCGKVLTAQEVIPATGEHSYADGVCTVCGTEDPGWLKITAQPESFEGLVGETAVFCVGINLENADYQWYFSNDGGETWQKASCTAASYAVEFKAYRLNYLYRCEVSDAETGVTVTSDAAVLGAADIELTILTQPVSYVGAVNDEVSFTVVADGNGLVYEWFYSTDGETWTKSYTPGYNTGTLTPILRAYRDGYMYKCVVTDVFGRTAESEAVSMEVGSSEVVIVRQPQPVENAVLGQLYKFTVEAEGENLTYRWEYSSDGGETWQESWNDGYSTDVLSVRMNANRDGNLYRCIVTSGQKIVLTSDAAILDLQDPSVELISQPESVYVLAGETAAFHVGAGGMDLTWLWYRSNDSGATWTQTWLRGYDTDTLSFAANTGRAAMYKCKVTDGSGKAVWSDTVSLKVLSAALKITAQPENMTCAAGGTASFSVIAEGDGLKYQWYASSDGNTWTATYLDGCNTAILSFSVTAARAAKLYKCVITDAAGNTAETGAVSVTISE